MADDGVVEVLREQAAESEPVTQEEQSIMLYSADVDSHGLRCWIRIPNKFQHRKIQKAAQAARARRVLEYKTEDSDAFVIAQSGVDQVFEDGSDKVKEWLVSQHYREKSLDAILEVERSDEWGEIDEQRERYQYLIRQGDTDTDEYAALEKILLKYVDLLEQKTNEMIEPFRQKYEAMTDDQLREKVRRAIIKADCDDEFTNVYNQWQIFYGTRHHGNHNRYFFKSFDAVMEADDDVIETLTDQFATLDVMRAGELKKTLLQTSSLVSSETSESSETGLQDGPKESAAQ